MKKKIKLILTVVMITSMLAACGKGQTSEGNVEENGMTSTEEDNKAQDSLEGDLTAVIDQIYKIADPGLNLSSLALDLTNADMIKYNTGLSDASKVKEIVVSEAMISSQAYSLVMVRANDAKDTESIANEMLEGIDQSKWICVTADDLKIAVYQDVIMLIMIDSQLSDSITSDLIVDAFKEICGSDLDLELEK